MNSKMKTVKLPVARNGGEPEIKAGRNEVTIKAPNFLTAIFEIKGTAPLVIKRFSTKTKDEMETKMAGGKSSSSKKNREPKTTDQQYAEACYISKDGWHGFHAAAIRNGCIRVCSLVDFKMTLAKMSIFVLADGYDAKEPQIPLVRIYGEPIKQVDVGRVANGAPYVMARPAYHDWSAKIRIRWDADQFTLQDVANLVSRVGQQAGIGEGRPSSKDSAGCGWGTFELVVTK